MVRTRKGLGTAVLAAMALVVVGQGGAEPLAGLELTDRLTAVLRGSTLYVDRNSAASQQVAAWKKARPAEAALLEREVASQPTGVWLGEWNRDVRGDVARIASDAARQNALPVLVAYNIPQRDCGSHSAGGARGADAYRSWIRDFARGLGGRPSVVVLEPDALASTECLSAESRAERFSLLKYAVQTLKAENAFVYIDAGHAQWLSPAEAAQRLVEAGVGLADGFSLNVSNFIGNSANIAYGNEVSRLTGGKRYVIDSSRSGAGSNGEWCNPSSRALGTRPTTRTAHPLLDAFLWVKKPGESDGSCNGGPSAGKWWPEYALGLAQRSTSSMALADADALP